jgi:hypothetical protein
MHGSEGKDEQHSTPQADPRSKLFLRVMGSLAIVGVMVGLMIGRLTAPDPSVLQQVEVTNDGLVVWFNNEPKTHGELVDGSVALLFEAEGRAQKGQLKLNGKDVNWRTRLSDGGLLLTAGDPSPRAIKEGIPGLPVPRFPKREGSRIAS